MNAAEGEGGLTGYRLLLLLLRRVVEREHLRACRLPDEGTLAETVRALEARGFSVWRIDAWSMTNCTDKTRQQPRL